MSDVVGEYAHPTRIRDVFRAGTPKHLPGSQREARCFGVPQLSMTATFKCELRTADGNLGSGVTQNVGSTEGWRTSPLCEDFCQRSVTDSTPSRSPPDHHPHAAFPHSTRLNRASLPGRWNTAASSAPDQTSAPA